MTAALRMCTFDSSMALVKLLHFFELSVIREKPLQLLVYR